jgi:hypothetical protein
MPMEQITGHRQLVRSCGGEGKDASKSTLLDENIASGEFQLILRYEAGVLEAILRVHVTVHGATMSPKVLRSDHDLLAYPQPK